MKFVRTTLIILALLGASLTAQAQSDDEAVRATAMDYLEGTANGEPERIRRAFHPDAALYAVNDDGSLRRIPIGTYIGYFKPGEKRDRDGKIVAVDVVNDAANVKIEIVSGPWKFTDYLLLLKLNGEWKIINKSYTRVKQ
ncbi:MAG TPA: dehydrogenase [Cytophagales bacterium]|nr:dehydrogenase [Cytophagales bacterium]HAP63614.1 dehydrogenase [Cytophagales bacterium]